MTEPENGSWKAIDLHGHGVSLDASVQQRLTRLPAGGCQSALSVDFNFIASTVGPHRNRIRPSVEQNDPILGQFGACPGKLTFDRQLTLAAAAVGQSSGEQDRPV